MGADPYYGYGYAGLGYLGYHGYAHGLKSAPCVNAANVPVPCAAGGYLHYGKREADADAEADAAVLYSGYGYPAYGYAGLGYRGLGYAGLGYAAPAVVAAAPAVVAAAPAVVAAAPARCPQCRSWNRGSAQPRARCGSHLPGNRALQPCGSLH